jgi:GDP-4-dehydro-6-deoxy-D-mannose reductase
VRVLITGATGFVGPHLAAHLAAVVPDIEIWGLVWSAENSSAPPGVHAVEGDLTQMPTLTAALEASRPEIVFHLAAASSVASSWNQPARVLEVNAIGTINLLEALRCLDLAPRVVVSSSAEIYGPVPAELQPITETAPLCPISPYATSKAAQDLIAGQYFHGFGLHTVCLRLFQHTGPGRPPHFAASSFARQIAMIERGLAPPRIAVGNLETVRDFTDVRDIVRAYFAAAVDGSPGTAYNVCSGRGVRIAEALEMLLELTEVEVEVVVDPTLLRASDIPHLVGSSELFRATTGWHPEIPLEKTFEDLLGWWRSKTKAGS